MKTISSFVAIATLSFVTSITPARAQTPSATPIPKKRISPPAKPSADRPAKTKSASSTDEDASSSKAAVTAPKLNPTPAPVAESPDEQVSPEEATHHEEKPVELGRTSKEIENDAKKPIFESSASDNDLTLGLEGTLLSLPIPTKYGPFIAYRFDKWAYEAAYFGGGYSLDSSFFSIGSVKENFLLFQARRFVGTSSFNWILGLSQQTYEAGVGQDILINTTGHPTSAELIKIRTLGLQLGLGNRWQMSNGLMFGADWLVLNFPFMTLENSVPILDYVNDQGTRDKVNDAIKILRYIPTFVIAKIQIGYSF